MARYCQAGSTMNFKEWLENHELPITKINDLDIGKEIIHYKQVYLIVKILTNVKKIIAASSETDPYKQRQFILDLINRIKGGSQLGYMPFNTQLLINALKTNPKALKQLKAIPELMNNPMWKNIVRQAQ